MLYENFITGQRKIFEGQEVFVLASGPSLVDFDYSKLDGKNVICVNHSYKKVKKALWTFAVDRAFVQFEDSRAPFRTTLICKKIIGQPVIEYKKAEKFSLNPFDGVWHVKSSGACALNSAIHAGFSKIYLLGFDCTITDLVHATDKEFRHRKKMWPTLTEKEKKKLKEHFEKTIKYFEYFPRDNIFNLSTLSAIPYFKKLDVNNIL
jgi:hypothetical protein